jgi:hypothetical protein
MALGLDPFAGKLRTGTVVMEFVAAPVRQRERSSYADGGKLGRQAGQRPEIAYRKGASSKPVAAKRCRAINSGAATPGS